MSLADGSHQGHDFPGQGNEPFPTPTPQVGTLVRFSQPIPYAEAWTLQKQLQEERIAERQGDVLLLLEHSPVYTLGRTTQPAHWDCGGEVLRRTGASLQSVDRGGSITYHGPGQVVGYPILKLSHYCSGPKQYVRKLEEVLIHTLSRWGIEGYRLEKNLASGCAGIMLMRRLPRSESGSIMGSRFTDLRSTSIWTYPLFPISCPVA